MPFISVLTGDPASQSRILKEYLSELEEKGYALQGRQEGGEWSALLSSLRTGSLFGQRSIIVVEEAEQLGKLPEDLSYLVEKDSDSGLVLLYKGKYRSFFQPETADLIAKVKDSPVPEWNDQRERWLLRLAQKKEIRIDPEAVSLLVEWIDNPEEIRSELLKLHAAAASFKGVVTVDILRQLTLDEGRKSLLCLLDGICFAAVDDVLKNIRMTRRNGMDLLYVISAVYNRIRLSLYYGHFQHSGDKQLEKVLKARKYQKKMALEMNRRFSSESVEELAIGLMGISYRQKTGKSAGWNEFENLLLRFMTKKAQKS